MIPRGGGLREQVLLEDEAPQAHDLKESITIILILKKEIINREMEI